MNINHSGGGAEWFRTPDAARYVGVSESMLNKLRMKHLRAQGPKFAKVCGCVVYRRADLDQWLSSHLVEAA
jgi:predicted DNA-binding transcriptional regulator AlpA